MPVNATFGSTSLAGLGLLIIELSISHSNISHSVGLLWMSDRSDAETSTQQHNTHNKQTSMLPAEFEPAIPASARPQTYTIDRAATGIGLSTPLDTVNHFCYFLQLN
jgi:hypothetical protein